MNDPAMRAALGSDRRLATIAEHALALYAACEQGAAEMTRSATGRDDRVALLSERALARFARCCECGATDTAMVPVISDETGALQFTCTGKRACRWRSQTRALQLAGVL